MTDAMFYKSLRIGTESLLKIKVDIYFKMYVFIENSIEKRSKKSNHHRAKF